MIQGLGIATVWTFDQQRTKAFFTEKLDFEVRSEVSMGEMTWVTVSAKEQQGVELALMSLDGTGVMGAGACRTDDCRGDYETFRARGVEFIQEPQERPYGIEAIFREDSGNWYSLTQRREDLDFSKDWA